MDSECLIYEREVSMTIGKASALTAGFLGAVALGIAIGPSLTHRDSTVTTAPAVEATQPEATPAPPRPVARAKKAKPSADTPTKPAATISLAAPELRERLKPVLNRGSNMDKATDGFRDAEQFATVAHAARNTNVPFVLLKHRVLNQGKSLATAIRESNPDLDAASEVARARTQARTDLASIAS
jgi:hypothetical protein